jgi:hypothetical protein
MVVLVVVLGVVKFSIASDLGYSSGDASTVVYLNEDEFGNIFTYDAVSDDRTGLISSEIRYVDAKEIYALEGAGVAVKIISHDGLSSRGVVADGVSASIPSQSSLPQTFSIVQFNGVVYGNFFVSGSQIPGKGTQWVAYSYSSVNMQNFGSHLAVALLVDAQQYYVNYPPTYAPALVGNGVIVGNASGTPNGCGFGSNTTPYYNMQVESYWNGGNRLYPETCSSSGLTDGAVYNVGVHANTLGYVSYGVSGGMNWSSSSPYTIPDRPAGTAGSLAGGGLFFGLVGIPSVTQMITLNFSNAATGWF